jgi:hypothetical protein
MNEMWRFQMPTARQMVDADYSMLSPQPSTPMLVSFSKRFELIDRVIPLRSMPQTLLHDVSLLTIHY